MSNHQHTLIIDGTSGISGDMTVAALLDLGASEEHLRDQLATLPVSGFEIAVTRVNKHGIDACDFDVQLAEELENHDHDMAWLYGNEAGTEHTHEHEHYHHDHGEALSTALYAFSMPKEPSPSELVKPIVLLASRLYG